MKMLSIDSISFRYTPEDPFVFSELSLKIPMGQTVLLSGENGAGKSTIGRLIAGLVAPLSGKIYVGDQEVHLLDAKNRVKAAYYIQQENQLQYMKSTLNDEISLTAILANREEPSINILGKFGLRTSPLSHPMDLSVNESWRFSLLLSSIINPQVLFIDELPSWSNKINQSVFLSVLEQRKRCNFTTIFSFQRELKLPFDKILTIRDGKIYDK